MSKQYDEYLKQHRDNVRKGFEWIKENLPQLVIGDYDYEWQIALNHDFSKDKMDEYDAYDEYFYGEHKDDPIVIRDFNQAWLLHIHRNPHHWQYWVLINDDPEKGSIGLDIPYNYILEMICDWWAFSWASGNLYEIFDWYEKHTEYMILNDGTRETINTILYDIKKKLDDLSATVPAMAVVE